LVALFVELKLWIPILVIAGVIGFIKLIQLLVDNSAKNQVFTRYITSFFQVLFSTLVFGLLVFGLISLFQGAASALRTEHTQSVVPHPKPVVQTDFIIPDFDNSYVSSPDTIIRVSVDWNDLNNISKEKENILINNLPKILS
jgi:hypothetical protein